MKSITPFCTRLSPSVSFQMVRWSIWSFACTRLWADSTSLFVLSMFWITLSHTHSTFPAEIMEDGVRADVVDRYDYLLTSPTWALIPVNTLQKAHRMRLLHHLLAQMPTLGSYALVAQNLVLCYTERSNHSLLFSVFLKFFTKWKKHPIISALGKEFEINRNNAISKSHEIECGFKFALSLFNTSKKLITHCSHIR